MRPAGIAIAIAGYALLAHYTNTMSKDGNLGTLAALAPLAFFAFLMAWNSSMRFLMLPALAISCLIAYSQWHAIASHFGLINWLQDMGMQLALFFAFGRTLAGGQKPLCVRFAEATHAPLTRQHETYARNATIAWTAFFGFMAMVSALLYFLAPLSVWSVFANFLTLPLIALMFLVEHRVRKSMLPDAQDARILDELRAFRKARS